MQLYSEFQHDTQEVRVLEPGGWLHCFCSHSNSSMLIHLARGQVHFRWMEQYGIDGVFLQCFTSVSSCVPESALDPELHGRQVRYVLCSSRVGYNHLQHHLTDPTDLHGRQPSGGCYYHDNITTSSLAAATRHGRALAMMYKPF